MEYLIASRLVLEMPETSVDNNELTMGVASVSMIASAFILPLIYCWIITKNNFELRKRKTFRRKWYLLYEDIKPKSKIALLFNVFFVVRRMIYVETAFSLNDHPCQQFQILMLMNLIMQVFLGNFRPLITRKMNKMEIYNDLIVYIVTFHFFLFTDFVPD